MRVGHSILAIPRCCWQGLRLFYYNPAKERRFNLRHDVAMRYALAALLLALGGQVAFWNHARGVMPEMGIVPDVPGERTVQALSFGDNEAFFRLLALNIQTSGDTFGRFTPLYKYDFNKLYQWFHLLDGLNNQSNYLPAMATYYFSQTQNPSDVKYMVDYLDEYTDGRAKEKWWWVVQGVYLAQHKLFNLDRALQLAERLRGVRGIPMWAQQTPAFIREQRGEFGQALAIIQDIIAHQEDYSLSELRFMKYFIDERLGKMKDVKAQLDAIEAEKQQAADAAKAAGKTLKEPDNGPPSDVGAPKAPHLP